MALHHRFLRYGCFATLAVATGVALGLGGLELATRALAVTPPLRYGSFVADEVLPWKLAPRESYQRTVEGINVHYYHNALGFRDSPIDAAVRFEKPPNDYRVVGIGDSFTFGDGVDYAATSLELIEAALNARAAGFRVEAVNLGLPRYWPEPEALVLEHYGIDYQPDLVIVGVTFNDFNDTRIGTEVGVQRGYLITSRGRRLGPVGQWFFLNSHLARVIIGEMLADTSQRKESNSMGKDAEAVWSRMHDAWNRMIDLARGADAQILFVHIPSAHRLEIDARETSDQLRRLCAARDCAVADALPALRSHPDPLSLFYQTDGHCNEAGYAFIADVALRELDAREMLPKELRSSG